MFVSEAPAFDPATKKYRDLRRGRRRTRHASTRRWRRCPPRATKNLRKMCAAKIRDERADVPTCPPTARRRDARLAGFPSSPSSRLATCFVARGVPRRRPRRRPRRCARRHVAPSPRDRGRASDAPPLDAAVRAASPRATSRRSIRVARFADVSKMARFRAPANPASFPRPPRTLRTEPARGPERSPSLPPARLPPPPRRRRRRLPRPPRLPLAKPPRRAVPIPSPIATATPP